MELIYPYDIAPVVPAPTADSTAERAVACEWFPVVEPSGLVVGRSTRSYCHSGAKPLHPVIHIHIIDRLSRIYLQKWAMNKDIQILFSDPYMMKNNRRQVAHYIHAWRLFVATGMRRGELCGLKHEDISGSMISIRRSINAEGEETHGKNDNARRSFAITEGMRKILEDQYAFMDELGISSDWVFPDKYGERSNPKAIYFSWRAYAGQHGMECSVHELRHTFISINKADMPLELLKAVVGHSSSMDTIGIYGHEVDGDKERAAAIMDSTFKKTLERKLRSEE